MEANTSAEPLLFIPRPNNSEIVSSLSVPKIRPNRYPDTKAIRQSATVSTNISAKKSMSGYATTVGRVSEAFE